MVLYDLQSKEKMDVAYIYLTDALTNNFGDRKDLDRWDETCSVTAISILAIARVVHVCFHKVIGITEIAVGIFRSDLNDLVSILNSRT